MGETSNSLQVLVVEDDDAMRDCLCDLLASERYQPIGCKSGEAAWLRLRWGLRPSVMIVDLALQRMSGRELLGLLRGQAWGQSIPVVLLSGWDRAERFADHADAVLTKGAESTSIIRTIDRLALRGRSAGAAAALSERRPPHHAEAREHVQPAWPLAAAGQ